LLVACSRLNRKPMSTKTVFWEKRRGKTILTEESQNTLFLRLNAFWGSPMFARRVALMCEYSLSEGERSSTWSVTRHVIQCLSHFKLNSS
jgi:hypothetical protein